MKISVEYAHTNLAAIDTTEMARSASAAMAVVDYLRAQGHEVRTTVLLDDKKLDRAEAQERAAELLSMLGDLGALPDEHFYERDLMPLLDDFGALLPQRRRRDLGKTTRWSLRKYDSLPCTVDIALWHSMRLGVVVGDRADEVADVVVSVLGDSHEDHEVRARKDFLNHVGPKATSKHVIDLYYPERTSAPFDPQALVHQLAAQLKESTSCPPS